MDAVATALRTTSGNPAARRAPPVPLVFVLPWLVLLGAGTGYFAYHHGVRHGSELDPGLWTTRDHLLRSSFMGGARYTDGGLRLQNKAEAEFAALPPVAALHFALTAQVPDGAFFEMRLTGAGDGVVAEPGGHRAPGAAKPPAKPRTLGYAWIVNRTGTGTPSGIYQWVNGHHVAGPRLHGELADGDMVKASLRIGEGVGGEVSGELLNWPGSVEGPSRLSRLSLFSGMEPVMVESLIVTDNNLGVPAALRDVELLRPNPHRPRALALAALLGVLGLAGLAWIDGLLLSLRTRLPLRSGWRCAALLLAPVVALPVLAHYSWEGVIRRLGLVETGSWEISLLVVAAAVALLHLAWVARRWAPSPRRSATRTALGLAVAATVGAVGLCLLAIWLDPGATLSEGAADRPRGWPAVFTAVLLFYLTTSRTWLLRGSSVESGELAHAWRWNLLPFPIAAALLAPAAALGGPSAGAIGSAALGGWLLLDIVFHQRLFDRIRGPAALQLLATVPLLLVVEVGVRSTYLERVWAPGWLEVSRENDAPSWIASELDLASAGLDLSPWTRGERIPDRAGAVRIVCLGGSSTAGWSDMRSGRDGQPYPAQLEDALGEGEPRRRYQVLNQGYEGFNTLHIAAYFRSFVAGLQPDLITLYVGYNDLMTRWSATPWRDSMASRGRPRLLGWAHGRLGRLRSLNGLYHLAVHTSPDPSPVDDLSPAVPVAHARDNLQEIIDGARAQDTAVVLMSEANLEPGMAEEFDRYDRMLADLAEQVGVDYLDTAAAMTGTPGPGWFDDTVHLAPEGHRALAEFVAGGLLAGPLADD